MIDVASALEYLHFGYSISIVHCDVKPSNVLLDQDMFGHLSDFGIAKLLGEEESMTQTLATVGNMAPVGLYQYGLSYLTILEENVYDVDNRPILLSGRTEDTLTNTDVDALLVLKTRIAHDPNTLVANNWSTSASVCSWIGVTCGVRHYRVTALNISYLGLTWTIPPQLGNLSFLALLSINNNNFYGSLPYELIRLHRLKYINFNHNQLSGNVPSSIFNISSLQELSLKHNHLSSIVNVSSAGSNLMSLDLSKNVFEEKYHPLYQSASREIPKELGNLVELEILILSNNVLLKGQIPSLLFNISSLSIIELTNNSMTGDLPHNICSHQHPSALKRVLLSENQLTGTIPYNLWRCRELTDISLSYNQFTGRIPRDIGNLTMLKHLAIDGNNLVGEIPYEIDNLPNIEGLGLENNNLVGHIPATIFNISTLKLLTCRDNTLSVSLPSIIGFGVPNVEELNFGNNNLLLFE
ncbi:hypothetical protein JRO89_XS02G0289100 [Xanthoceras sorbifolium]|uniref:Protein kinase domain-containing protein n=1 Tax=Xanthoceras sorbifolium TaxID=99658 RepID=A0ABQ8IHF3_9ROSI|nr:hypothetical protein JRO89_XS02G0289100 [Xanthoceras sorbifolium]